MKSNQKILIVDDDPINVEILEEILVDNYITATANSGEEALDGPLCLQTDPWT